MPITGNDICLHLVVFDLFIRFVLLVFVFLNKLFYQKIVDIVVVVFELYLGDCRTEAFVSYVCCKNLPVMLL